MKHFHLLIIFFAIFFVSCNGVEPLLYVYNTSPNYTKGYVDFFGPEYALYANKNNVLSVSLFSDSLTVDTTGSLVGTGQYLFLEDVFVQPTDTLLPVGTYTINSTGLPFTVSPGRNDTVDTQVFQIGAMISYYEENAAKSTLKLITDGTFTVSKTGNNYTILCDFKTDDKKQLKGRFTGELRHYDRSLKASRIFVRKSRRLIHL